MAISPEIEIMKKAARAEGFSTATISNEAVKAGRMLANARETANRYVEQAGLVETIYVGKFLPDADEANNMAASIASGDITRIGLNRESLGRDCDTPDKARAYLSRFEALDPKADYPFPKLSFPTSAVLRYKDREANVGSHSVASPLEMYNFSPSFTPNIDLPTLFDPQVRSFAELQRLENLDPGYADQLFEGYRLAAQGLREKGGKFRDPKIVRMVAILPVGPDYMTDFVPEIGFPEKGTRAWNPFLFVSGALNPSGNYLSHYESYPKNRIVYNNNGRQAALRVSRALEDTQNLDVRESVIPSAQPKLDRVGVILFPYDVHAHKPEPVSHLSGYGSKGMYGADVTRSADLGGAEISIGRTGWAGADKRDTTWNGDTFTPTQDGQPFIYSVRLLTAQRPPREA